MEATAKAKYVRHGCRKIRQVADLVRGKQVDEAFAMLSVLKNTRKGAVIVENVLKSAVANLQQTEDGAGSSPDSLIVKSVEVDAGPLVKRIRARAQGRAFRIHKQLSHVTIVVAG